MKLSTAAAVLGASVGSSGAFTIQSPTNRITVAASSKTAMYMSTTEEPRKKTKKDDRLRFMKSDNFYRTGFKEVREDVENTMQQQFKSELVDDLKQNNYAIERDGVKVYLAKVSYIISLSLF